MTWPPIGSFSIHVRANHATDPQEPAPRGVTGAAAGAATGARHTIGRWLPRPRVAAAGGALLAQLWGFGTPAAYAVTADPAADQPHPAVRRAPYGGTAQHGTAPGGTAPGGDAPGGGVRNGDGRDRAVHDGTARDGQSAGRSAGQGPAAGNGAANAPGPVGPPDGDGLRERVRAGGLPLPGERAALPDAFALASGLLGGIPAQTRPAEPRATRAGEPTDLPTVPRQRAATTRPAEAQLPSGAATARPARDATGTTDGPGAPAAPDGGANPARSATAPTTTPVGAAAPEELALADTATVTTVDGSATATAVLAPIAAGLLLTGAAMCKHRGLPRGH
ncbi:hypothetical protein VM98_25865 [Streptomyces rubellomurinus subsp. indigoferus]|uniref:Uncharacterized protein n=1 Tax=Streptomyces rubellomurinus (strain ATCC 31215) TaxID=359131 RepID=A0A0F2T698_STRR3|nr:hypothetical protein VM98_25865 [Streptomyces rubellomurinus subsp. indigoferus]KJS58744.1 hypothetical protein VM95_31380 [Streptomyces rubellomurinus]